MDDRRLARMSGVLQARVRDLIAGAFVHLYQPTDQLEVPAATVRQAIIDQFNRLYFHSWDRTWQNTYYRGVQVLKCPLDLWVYQELICEVRPDLIVEAGTNRGGSAYYLADVCETQGRGRVVTIDVEERPGRPEHPRITYLAGRSTDEAVLGRVGTLIPPGGTVLVILDSDHSAENVKAELVAYAPMVTPGSYLIVEDTCIRHPVLPTFPPGPMEAVDAFLAGNRDFVIDESREKFMVTFNPSGYLRRVGAPTT